MRSALSKFPSPQELWAKHEELVLEVFILALTMLRNRANLPADEPAMNEVLALETRRANFTLNHEDRGLPFPPRWESPKPPTSEADLGQSKKAKRPDFSCPFRNNSAQSAIEAYQDYQIECKRLGEPANPSWNFSQNYVKNGIIRFLDSKHRYGEGTHTGAMIGYVQSMNLESILDEVNKHILSNADNDLPLISFLENDFGAESLAKTSQHLMRKHVSPSPFILRHLWVDLRRNLLL